MKKFRILKQIYRQQTDRSCKDYEELFINGFQFFSAIFIKRMNCWKNLNMIKGILLKIFFGSFFHVKLFQKFCLYVLNVNKGCKLYRFWVMGFLFTEAFSLVSNLIYDLTKLSNLSCSTSSTCSDCSSHAEKYLKYGSRIPIFLLACGN